MLNLNQRFTDVNITELLKAIQQNVFSIPQWQRDLWRKIKRELQVHTQGHFFFKSTDLFKEEPKEGKEYAVKSYEPITKGSITRGLLDIDRVFSTTTSNITIDVSALGDLKAIVNQYTKLWVDIGQAVDPNSIIAVIDNRIKTFESEDIIYIDDISFIALDKTMSTYTTEEENTVYLSGICGDKKLESFYRSYKTVYGDKKTIIVGNQFQNIVIGFEKGIPDYYIINDFKEPLNKKPYVNLGVRLLREGVYESALQGFVPFGNMCLLHHKTHRQVEALFGYPRMTEIETKCEEHGCINGQVWCTDPDKMASNNGQPFYENCPTCKGTGSISMQSLWRIYKRKVDGTRPATETGLAIPSVQFHVPPVDILDRTNDMWKDLLQMAEEAIFIKDKKETGNEQSAAAKEKDLQEKYNSYAKSANVFYSGLEFVLQSLYGKEVNVEKPMSLAVMGEIEAFQLLQLISTSNAPHFIKTAHLDNFLKKYVSQSNPIVRAVDVLKKYDLFLFYTNDELIELDSLGVISREDKLYHVYGFPLVMQLYYENRSVFNEGNIEKLFTDRLQDKLRLIGRASDNIKVQLANA